VAGEAVMGSAWSGADFGRVLFGATTSLIGIVVTWYLASGTANWSRQLLWIGVGAGMLVIGLLSLARWLIGGLAQLRIAREFVIAQNTRLLQPDGTLQTGAARAAQDSTVILGRGTRYHRDAQCQLLVGKSPVHRVPRSEAVGRFLPCGMCGP
jgi:hypothetical protein